MNLRDEIEAVMGAQVDQSDAVHRLAQGIREGKQEFDIVELVHMIGAISGAQRQAILRLADEIDDLLRAHE